MNTHNRAPAIGEQTSQSPEESRAWLGAAMMDGFGYEQESEPSNLFAPELETNPILEISEVQGSEGIFNGTILTLSGGEKYLFARRRLLEAAPWGQPDASALVMSRLDTEMNIVSTTEVWSPENQQIYIEDPRAYQTDQVTTIGVTVVRKTEGNKAYPAVIEVKSPEQLLTEPLPQPRVIEKFGGGDQATPLGGSVEGKNATSIDDKRLMYRPEGLTHTLQVLERTEDDDVHAGFIDFPKNIPWALYKIGTTAPPAWLNEQEAFIELHGINIADGLFVYSIGTARLLRTVDGGGRVSFSVDNISREAIITPDTFPPLTDGRQVELHPDKRRALYNCGAISIWNGEGELVRRELLPSQGDMRTYDVGVDAGDIVGGWDRTIPDRRRPSVAA